MIENLWEISIKYIKLISQNESDTQTNEVKAAGKLFGFINYYDFIHTENENFTQKQK